MAALFHTNLSAMSHTAFESRGAVRTAASCKAPCAGVVGASRLRMTINAGEQDALGARCAR